jgi:hypothetical protein
VIFLPVVDRELRVAARKRSTFWIRIAAALILLIIGAGFMVMVGVSGGFLPTPTLGKYLFTVLTWLSLAAALFAGFFFTSDCLSEEKREGTLGFLFLTDLRGYDVVLGKFVAMSVCSFYTFLAVLPVLAITLLMGGVTGTEFWKTCIAVLNALFLSLATGMLVSSFSRDSQKAMSGTFVLLIMLSALGPSADALWAQYAQHAFRPLVSTSSPVYLFVTAGFSGRSLFWQSLLVNQCIAWAFLALSCVLLPRTWQQKSTRTSVAAEGWSHWWRFGGTERRLRLRRRLIDINPVLWLVCRERWQAVSFWVVTAIACTALAALLAFKRDFVGIISGYVNNLLSLVLYLGVAAQSNRFLVTAQRSGLTELLLATPLTVKSIVQGHWRATLRMLALPLLVCLTVQFVGAYIATQNMQRLFANAVRTTTTTTTNSNGMVVVSTSIGATTAATPAVSVSAQPLLIDRLLPLISAATHVCTTVANLIALCWFGMWMGMTSRNSNIATLKTIAFAQVLPWFVMVFASNIVGALLMTSLAFQSGATRTFSYVWYQIFSALTVMALSLIKDAGFAIWARRKLYSDFRSRAAGTVLPIQGPLPPVLVAPVQVQSGA